MTLKVDLIKKRNHVLVWIVHSLVIWNIMDNFAKVHGSVVGSTQRNDLFRTTALCTSMRSSDPTVWYI